MKDYTKYMKKCFELAKNGIGKVSPNPLVGCVVLDKNDNEIATGFHSKYGENHAERDALLKLHNDEAKDGTLIVNLEPCSHYGKTPPCADLIIEKGIKKVIIAMHDVNPVVKNNGIKKLIDAGIDVIDNVLIEEAEKLNEIFIKNMKEKKIFIALKTATTLDGKIATKTGASKWITSDDARKKAKELRLIYDAVLTTSNTVLSDNPDFDVPLKILLDKDIKCNFNMNFFKTGKIIIVVDENKNLPKNPDNVEFIQCRLKDKKLDLDFLFEKLYEKKIMSIFVEAGGILSGTLISKNLVDKVYHFIAPKIIADNEAKSCFAGYSATEISQSFNFKFERFESYEPDLLLVYEKIKP